MSGLERRLQILIDEERYGRLAAEADRSHRSVAAIIREAIDFAFPQHDHSARSLAAQQLLDLTEDPGSALGESPADLKTAYAAELDSKIS